MTDFSNKNMQTHQPLPDLGEGGMVLYVKAAEDGKSVGDCPFTQYVRMVLEEKGLDYDVRPCTAETKPQWLIELYEGKMPALRHRRECYTESEVIAQYLEFFFSGDEYASLAKPKKKDMSEASEVVGKIFPAIAKYLKHTPDGDDEDDELKNGLGEALSLLEAHLTGEGRTGPFIVGDGEHITLLDCNLAPKLYHMKVGMTAFKDNAVRVDDDFPAVAGYINTMFNRESFIKTKYPEETIVWGWGNARSK
mmetsp:Transcript_29256/g.45463  ORF Transcript_29256/g.45463 Transcript_29256/m.45463 type:complete len:250 (-) Transcript_29256:864-1613(-)